MSLTEHEYRDLLTTVINTTACNRAQAEAAVTEITRRFAVAPGPVGLPVGQVRRGPGRLAARTAEISLPWCPLDGRDWLSDDEVRDWEVVWTPGDEVLPEAHVAIDLREVSHGGLDAIAKETWDAPLGHAIQLAARAELARRDRGAS